MNISLENFGWRYIGNIDNIYTAYLTKIYFSWKLASNNKNDKIQSTVFQTLSAALYVSFAFYTPHSTSKFSSATKCNGQWKTQISKDVNISEVLCEALLKH